MMVTISSDTCLTVLLIAITMHLSESVSSNVGAPDSSNLNMVLTPDDSVAGGIDTSLDNSNATPLTITTPASTTTTTRSTTSTTTTTTAAPTTTSLSVTSPAKTTERVVTTTKLTTLKPSSSSASTTNIKIIPTTIKTIPWRPDPTNLDVSGQNQYNNLGDNNNPYQGTGPHNNGWQQEHAGHHYPQSQGNQGRRPNGRFNLPWWMLLFDEV